MRTATSTKFASGAAPRSNARQLELFDRRRPGPHGRLPAFDRTTQPVAPVCAGCRAKEARYGFRDEERPDRPRTLCFECFRMEIARRQASAARLARNRGVAEIELPLSDRLHQIDVRRRRAQIAARRALATLRQTLPTRETHSRRAVRVRFPRQPAK